MSVRPTPKVHEAVRFLTAGIESGRFPSGQVLPPVRRLAANAGVSLVTMWRAIHRLKGEGRVSGEAGMAPRVAGGADDEGVAIEEFAGSAAHPRRQRRSRIRLADRIRKDILNGLYQPGVALPLLKELANHYLTSTHSLREVLGDLCTEGILKACGRGYSAPRLSSGRSGAAIGFLAHREYLDYYYRGMPQGHDYIKDTQLYASQAGVRLIVEPYYRNDESGLYLDPESSLFSEDQVSDALGYIYILSESYGFNHILRRLVALNKPISILEQNGYWQLPSWLRSHPVMVIPVGVTPDCGEIVGRFLISLGHRRVAYFSPYHPGVWSVARCKGLSTVFEQAGLPGAVLPFVTDYANWYGDANFRGDASSVPRLKVEWPAEYRSPTWRMETEGMETMLQSKVNSSIVVRRVLQGLFEQAVDDKRITAWVGANDQTAALALEFLRERGVKVPQDISVVSFDDSYVANAHQLTSYNFNIPAIMGGAIRHILQNQALPSARRAKILHIDGMVIERQSTAPAAHGL